jgi:hypothetical protein
MVARPGAPPEQIELRGDGVIVPPTGHASHQRDRIRIGTPGRAAARGPRHAHVGVTAALPMDHEHDRTRVIVDIRNDLVDEDADDALLNSTLSDSIFRT